MQNDTQIHRMLSDGKGDKKSEPSVKVRNISLYSIQQKSVDSVMTNNVHLCLGEILTDCFLLLTSAYFCKNGTRADGGSVAGSGWRHEEKS